LALSLPPSHRVMVVGEIVEAPIRVRLGEQPVVFALQRFDPGLAADLFMPPPAILKK
jgi:hypothetical protein